MTVDLAIERVAPPDTAAWDALVQGSKEATIFHTAAWANVWTSEWRDARWEALVLGDGAGGYAGGIGMIARKRGLLETVDSMPFATYGGPIVRNDHPDPVSARASLLEAFARRIGGRLVMRSSLAWYEGVDAEFPEDLPREESFTHVLALDPDYERVADGFSASTRRLVRQSDASGLTIRACESPEDVTRFAELAEETVRRRGGKPKPRSLYERIFEMLVPQGLARYHLAMHGDDAVAGSLHFFHEGVATSWLPVSRESSWHLRPNNFLIASLLETLCGAGYLAYNFGASPPDAAGLIRFKEGWGAKRRPVWLAGKRTALHRRLRP